MHAQEVLMHGVIHTHARGVNKHGSIRMHEENESRFAETMTPFLLKREV